MALLRPLPDAHDPPSQGPVWASGLALLVKKGLGIAEGVNNALVLRDASVVDPDGELLLDNLTANQQRKLRNRLDHPFYWAAPIMLGLPW